MRYRLSLVFLALALLAAAPVQSSSHAAPVPPTAVRVAWVTPSTARLSWTQQSDANTVCLTSINGAGDFFNSIEVCMPSAKGPHTYDLARTAFPYGVYTPTAGDMYYLTEWTLNGPAQQFYGHYGPFPLESVSYLPLVAR
jgi:hypothetical protein